jgi:hypothetical protein
MSGGMTGDYCGVGEGRREVQAGVQQELSGGGGG